eukprot:scaffold34387_cov169-Isochrysis_galbana.AAC.1
MGCERSLFPRGVAHLQDLSLVALPQYLQKLEVVQGWHVRLLGLKVEQSLHHGGGCTGGVGRGLAQIESTSSHQPLPHPRARPPPPCPPAPNLECRRLRTVA